MKQLYYDTKTLVIFGSETPGGLHVELIEPADVDALMANGASIDASATDLLGKQDSSPLDSQGATDAPVADVSANTSDTGDDAGNALPKSLQTQDFTAPDSIESGTTKTESTSVVDPIDQIALETHPDEVGNVSAEPVDTTTQVSPSAAVDSTTVATGAPSDAVPLAVGGDAGEVGSTAPGEAINSQPEAVAIDSQTVQPDSGTTLGQVAPTPSEPLTQTDSSAAPTQTQSESNSTESTPQSDANSTGLQTDGTLPVLGIGSTPVADAGQSLIVENPNSPSVVPVAAIPVYGDAYIAGVTDSGTALDSSSPSASGFFAPDPEPKPGFIESAAAQNTDVAATTGESGNVAPSAVEPVAPATDSAATAPLAVDPALAAADKVDAPVIVDNPGNALGVAGVPGVDISSPPTTSSLPPDNDYSATAEHPAKVRARWLHRKIEAGEALVMADLLAVLRDIIALDI